MSLGNGMLTYGRSVFYPSSLMGLTMKIFTLAMPLAIAAGLVSVSANAATISFTDRGAFTSALTRSFTDTFETNLGYRPGFSITADAAFSAIVGQTRFNTTGFQNLNILNGPGVNGTTAYCAGCNGSFTLFFDATTFGTANGVGGVGVDFTFNQNYDAFVTFGDNSTRVFTLTKNAQSFFGLTSDRLIKSIAFGPGGNGISRGGSTQIDNLTIGVAGAVPEPATWAMMLLGFGMMGAAARHRRSPATVTA